MNFGFFFILSCKRPYLRKRDNFRNIFSECMMVLSLLVIYASDLTKTGNRMSYGYVVIVFVLLSIIIHDIILFTEIFGPLIKRICGKICEKI